MKLFIDGKETHITAIEALIQEAEGKATARCLSYEKIASVLEGVESNLGISKKAMAGTTVFFDGAEKFPSAYKYQPESTHFAAVHNGRVWELTSVTRGYCPNRIANSRVALSDSAKAALIEKASMMEL